MSAIHSAKYRIGLLLCVALAASFSLPASAGHRPHPPRYHHYHHNHHYNNWGWNLGLSALWLSPWVWDNYSWQQPRYMAPAGQPLRPASPSVATTVTTVPTQVTTGYRVVNVGPQGRSELPANAKVIQQDGRTLYQWQGQLYRFDWNIQQYVPVGDASASE